MSLWADLDAPPGRRRRPTPPSRRPILVEGDLTSGSGCGVLDKSPGPPSPSPRALPCPCRDLLKLGGSQWSDPPTSLAMKPSRPAVVEVSRLSGREGKEDEPWTESRRFPLLRSSGAHLRLPPRGGIPEWPPPVRPAKEFVESVSQGNPPWVAFGGLLPPAQSRKGAQGSPATPPILPAGLPRLGRGQVLSRMTAGTGAVPISNPGVAG